MTSLSDKLQALGVQVGAKNLPAPKRKRNPNRLENVLPGRWQETRHGDVFVVEKRYPSDFLQGEIPLCPTAPLDIIAAWAKTPQLTNLPLETFAFIDTETTGLSGGAGTYTFLIGVGRFVGEEFHLAQFFMRDPCEEAAQLAALEEFLAPCSAVVSYNGKSFDMPRLKTRYTAHGWSAPLQDAAHIDLLHLARRIWKERLPTRALGDIEFHILGFERTEEDVPGWQVADLFFDYLRTQDAQPLKSVFYHNDMDVVSMAAILNRTAEMLAHPLSQNVRHPLEMLTIGKLFIDLEQFDRGISVYERALKEESLPPEAYWKVLKNLSMTHKKQENLVQALPLWEKAAQAGQIYANVELAKVYEHKRKNYAEAVHWTLMAIEKINENEYPKYKRTQWQPKLKHRLKRLKQKLEKQQGMV